MTCQTKFFLRFLCWYFSRLC